VPDLRCVGGGDEPAPETGDLTLAAGIDLSGRTTGTTAVAWVEGSGDGPPRIRQVIADPSLRGRTGDRRICDRLGRPGVVAIDAPLSLPHPVVCDDPSCPECFPSDGSIPSYGARTEIESPSAWAEVEHTEKGPMPMVMVSGIAFRAIYLRRLLEREGHTAIEVWPMGAYRAIARALDGDAAAGDTGNEWRRSLLSERLEGLDQAVPRGGEDERDRLDSVAAAFVGWLWLNDRARPVPGDAPPDRPAIWIP
jgi:predicted nuclease with RNAse H fold